MRELVVLQITIFSMMGMGYLARKLRLVSEKAQQDLSNLVLYMILPANIVTSFIMEFNAELLRDCLLILAISLATQIFYVIFGKLCYRKQPDTRRKNLIYATICPNSGFLGNPIAEGVYGPVGLILASVYLIPQRVMIWTEGLALYAGGRSWKDTLRKVLTHPCILACVVGIILLVTQYQPPDYILTPLKTLGRCNTAMSMLVIGLILADADLKTVFDRTIILFTVSRLVVLPLVLFLVLRLLPLGRMVYGISVLLAAMPAGATTSMMASKYEQEPQFAAKLVAFSTLLSMPAICLWTWILR